MLFYSLTTAHEYFPKRSLPSILQGNSYKTTSGIFSTIEGGNMIYLKCIQKTLLTKNTLSRKFIIQNQRKIKSFPDRQRLKEFITTKLLIKEMLKGLPEAEKKNVN